MITVHVLPLGSYQTNCYLAWGEDAKDCIVIDPGYDPEEVLAYVRNLGKTVAAVLLTHGHFDHVGGVQTIGELTRCPVYIHEDELSMPEGWTGGPLYYTHTYGEGDRLELAGMELRVLHTPGHTPGSVCLAAENYLFSGDTLFQDSCGRTDLPGGSTPTLLRSLKRLAALERDYNVLPGHGPDTTLGEEKKYNPYLR